MIGSAGGAIYEGMAYCAMSHFLTLKGNGKTVIFLFFVIRVYYEKLGHRLKPIVPRFCPDLSALLRDIAEKQVPAKLKPIAVGAKKTVEMRSHRLQDILHIVLILCRGSNNNLQSGRRHARGSHPMS